MMKTVVVLQSNYIPWKGYFDLINDADEFIFYDFFLFDFLRFSHGNLEYFL